MKNLKFIVLLGLLVITGIISWNIHFKVYMQEDKVNIHTFPKEINGWTSEEMPITEKEYAILETRNAFIRKYTSPEGKEVYLFTVYSESNRKVSHPPEICYTGAGVTVAESSIDTVTDTTDDREVKVNRLLLDMGRLQQIAFYWFKVGDDFTSNYWRQQGLIALKSLLGQPSSSALIRVSATVQGGDEDAAGDRIREFTREAFPYLHKHLPAE